MNRALKLARWLPPAAALFALACALLAPAEAGSARAGGGSRGRAAQIDESVREGRDDPKEVAVRGRVVYDDTERPVRRVRVWLIGKDDVRKQYSAFTDAHGDFRVPRVRAGRYVAYADVPGFLSPSGFRNVADTRYGAGPGIRDRSAEGVFLDVVEVDGKEDMTITVRARRGAALSGRVTYADGDPAVNVTLILMRRDASGQLQKSPAGINMVEMSEHTDDRGMYRLTGLPPGEYVVGVSEPVNHVTDAPRRPSDDDSEEGDPLKRQQLLMTFHPSSTSVKEAAFVKVAAGEERADVDVRIPERELRTVAGVVLSRRDRRPLAGARVTFMRRDDPIVPAEMSTATVYSAPGFNETTTDEEGRWRFTEIPDGPYTVTVRPAKEHEPGDATANMNVSVPAGNRLPPRGNMNGSAYQRPRRTRGYAPARRDVEVAADLSDVTVEMADGARVAGTVTTEDGEPVEYARVSLLRASDDPAGVRAVTEARYAAMDEVRFSADGLPAGRYFLQPDTFHNEPPLYVKSITWNGKDLTRAPLELAEGATVEGVRVVYASGSTGLRVKAVRGGERKPVLNTFVVLVPASGPDWSPRGGRQLTCFTDDEGECTVQAPPGDYRVVALERNGPREGLEAEVRRHVAAAPLVSLRAGEMKELEAVVPDR